jgi:hypothetical protein
MKINDLLLEAQNYEAMFSKIIDIITSYGEGSNAAVMIPRSIENDIKWAKSSLKRSDRIIWILRLMKLNYLRDLLRFEFVPDDVIEDIKKDIIKTARKANVDIGTPIPISMLVRDIEHFLSLPIQKIQDYQFTNQTPSELKSDLDELEQEWIGTRKEGGVEIQIGDEKLIEFDGGSKAWWLLNRGACREEGDKMGHCGNSPTVKGGDRILSFRTATDDPNFWVPHMTFILDDNKMLGEMKGKANKKPADKYHPYIVTLLRHKIIQGIKGGGGEPEENFSLHDLDDSTREKLLSEKPELGSLYDFYKKEGLTNRVKNMIYDKVSDLRLPDIHSIDEDNVTLQHFGDFEEFLKEIKYIHPILEALHDAYYFDDEVSSDDIKEVAENLVVDTETYRRVIDKLSDKTLQKISTDIGMDFDFDNISDREELAEIIEQTKYADDIKYGIAEMITLGKKNILNDSDYPKFQELLLQAISYSMRGASNEYLADVDLDNLRLMISTNDFIGVISDEEDESEGYYFRSKYSGQSDYIYEAIDSYDLRGQIKDKDFIRYSTNEDDGDEKLFEKFIDRLEAGESETIDTKDLKTLDFDDIANMIERRMVMVDSRDLSRLKMLAGLK